MRKVYIMQALDVSYLPRSGDPVEVHIPALSDNPICTTVYQRTGGFGKGKIVLYCPTGPTDLRGNLQLIWKPSTKWFAWLLGKKYVNVTVGRP